MKRPHQIASVLFLLFSAFIARESLELKYYTSLGPGPGFFPLWLSGVLIALAALELHRATFGQSDPEPNDLIASGRGYLRIGAILLAVVGVILLMKPLGFRLTTLAFLLFLLCALGRPRLIVTVPVVLAGSFGVFYLFHTWLKVSLPIGMFGI